MSTTEPVLIRVPQWEPLTWLVHGFSTRVGGTSTVYSNEGAGDGRGELNLGFTADDDPAAVATNRLALVRAVAHLEAMELVLVRQVHGTEVHVVRKDNVPERMVGGRATTDGDGLITDVPGVLIGVQAADCVPVLLVDTRLERVAALHAGWRGTVAGIVGQGVQSMLNEGSRVADLSAAIGPSIGPCCYRVGGDVRQHFGERYAYAAELFSARGGAEYLDLWKANQRQLVDAGLALDAITVLAECSACSIHACRRKYFSHRADHGRSGRMMAVIGVRHRVRL